MNQALTPRATRRLLALILGVYALLAIAYSVASPPFETPDENLHYFTADFIARNGRLPTTSDPGGMGQEAAQPPLYYATAALLIRALDRDGQPAQLWPNPRVDVSSVAGNLWISPLTPPNPRGESGARPAINANMFVRAPEEQWPWRGHILAAHAARLLSAALGLGTLLCIYAAGRVVWPAASGRALLATALVAFLPQFAFIHAAVSNDAAITLFSAAALWQLLRLLNPPAPPRPRSPAPLLFLGLTIGLAMLSKAAGLLLLAYGAGVVGLLALAEAWPEGAKRAVARAAVAVAGVVAPALLLGGWLLWRNWTLYGDPTAASQFVAIAGGYRPYSLLQVAQDMDRVWLSFFALFGWMSVQPPAWIHIVWNLIVLLAMLGAGWSVVRGRRWAGARRFVARQASFLVLLGWFLLVSAGWLQFMLRTSADQGRLFFPALVPLALAAAYGLSRWPRPWTQLAAVGLALATSIYCVAVVLPETFARPAVVSAAPAEVALLDIRFDEGLTLLGAVVETPLARPGDWVWATLYWQADAAGRAASPLVYLELFGRDFARIGNVVAFPGRGGYPAAFWPDQGIIADRLAAQVRLPDDTAVPVAAQLAVKLSEDADSVSVGTVKVVPARWPARVEPLATLGAGIELARAELAVAEAAPGDSVAVRLRWQVSDPPPGPADLHLFVHLGDPAQAPLAQSDGPVMGGQYPPRLWATGEVFDETAVLALPAGLPPGDYPVQIGLYDFASGARLPVTVAGQRSPSDTVPLGVLRVR